MTALVSSGQLAEPPACADGRMLEIAIAVAAALRGPAASRRRDCAPGRRLTRRWSTDGAGKRGVHRLADRHCMAHRNGGRNLLLNRAL